MLKRVISKGRGFTLVELLVAVSIVAILAAAGFASYRTASAKARDSRRQADLAKVQTALEMYRSSFTSYPTGTFLQLLGTLNTNGFLSDTNIDDPDPALDYYYSSTGSTYELCADLTTPVGDTCTHASYDYGVKNP